MFCVLVRFSSQIVNGTKMVPSVDDGSVGIKDGGANATISNASDSVKTVNTWGKLIEELDRELPDSLRAHGQTELAKSHNFRSWEKLTNESAWAPTEVLRAVNEIFGQRIKIGGNLSSEIHSARSLPYLPDCIDWFETNPTGSDLLAGRSRNRDMFGGCMVELMNKIQKELEERVQVGAGGH